MKSPCFFVEIFAEKRREVYLMRGQDTVSVLKGEKVDPVLVIPTTIVDRSDVDEYLDPNNTVY